MPKAPRPFESFELLDAKLADTSKKYSAGNSQVVFYEYDGEKN